MKIKRQMWKTIAVGTAVLLLTTAAVAQKPDLTFEYPPNWTPVLRVEKERLELHQYRSYRVVVTIQNKGTVRAGSFNVTAVIVRGGQTKEIGKARVGDTGSGRIYACFDMFPSSAPAGPAELRFVIDADKEVNESDESNISNVWTRKVTLIRP